MPTRDAPCPHCGQLLWLPLVGDELAVGHFVGGGRIFELDAETKEEAFRLLLEASAAHGGIEPNDVESLLARLMHRESLGSTGVGDGYAIPHATYEGLEDTLGIVGRTVAPIDFGSLDGQAVRTLFLLLSPPDQPARQLRALERVCRWLRLSPLP